MSDFLDGLVIGLHLLSAHSDPAMHDANTGIYLRTAAGATVGYFENSISGTTMNGNDGRRRMSTYLGWTFETSGQALALTLGAVNGYGAEERRTCVPDTSPPMAKANTAVHATSTACSSSSYQPAVRDVLPLLVASGRLPLGDGWATRLGYVFVPGAFGDRHMHVANLMLERRF